MRLYEAKNIDKEVEDLISDYIMDYDDFIEINTFNNHFILLIFFLNDEFMSLSIINPYSEKMLREFNLPYGTCEITGMYIADSFDEDIINELMIENITKNFTNPLKVTLINNTPIKKLLSKYSFKKFNNKKSIDFWERKRKSDKNDKRITMIRDY